MRIEKIYLRHVGPFDEITIDLPKGTDLKRADTYIFTGLNGSGKSTVLYAIAAALSVGNPDAGSENISRRMWAEDSFIALSIDGETLIVGKDIPAPNLVDPFQREIAVSAYVSSSKIRQYVKKEGVVSANIQAIQAYQRANPSSVLITPSKFVPTFAYAGYRTFESYKVGAIQELTQSPLAESLSFIKTGGTQQLAQWIANTDYKEAIYQRNKEYDKAKQQSAAITRISDAISEISDIKLSFVVDIDPINVMVKQNDTITTLDLLPDGLKSIASFLADLLMRLDRLPPHSDYAIPLDRPFILLLDEIDIHLHAKWQRQVLPVVQKLFPNAQILLSTHSPFVVGSAFDAHIIQLKTKDGKSVGHEVFNTQLGQSYDAILRLIFDLTERFDPDTERRYQKFEGLCDDVLTKKADFERDLLPEAKELSKIGLEVSDLVAIKVRQTQRQLNSILQKR